MKYKFISDGVYSHIIICKPTDPDGVNFSLAKRELLEYLRGRKYEIEYALKQCLKLRKDDIKPN